VHPSSAKHPQAHSFLSLVSIMNASNVSHPQSALAARDLPSSEASTLQQPVSPSLTLPLHYKSPLFSVNSYLTSLPCPSSPRAPPSLQVWVGDLHCCILLLHWGKPLSCTPSSTQAAENWENQHCLRKSGSPAVPFTMELLPSGHSGTTLPPIHLKMLQAA